MYVKIHNKKPPTGIPAARVAVTSMHLNPLTAVGTLPVVMVRISTLDAHDIPTVAASLRLSPTEARDLGARLIAAAEQPLCDAERPYARSHEVYECSLRPGHDGDHVWRLVSP